MHLGVDTDIMAGSYLDDNVLLNSSDVLKKVIINKKEIETYIESSDSNTYFKEHLVETMIELDYMMKNTHMTNNQKKILYMVISGFSYTEIGRMLNKDRSAIWQAFDRLCRNMLSQNNNGR